MIINVSYNKLAKINQLESVSELAEVFLQEIRNLFLENQQPFYYIALSGGSTPIKIYQSLSEKDRKSIDWTRVVFYWGDERCVPPESEESNYGNAKRFFLDYLEIPSGNIRRIKGEEDPAREVERYSSLLNPLPVLNNFPVFDLIFLGVGEDGHTASLFPDNLSLLESDNRVVNTRFPKTGQDRISLTAKLINNARRIVFLVSGQSKNEITDDLFRDDAKAKSYPAYYIRPTRGALQWYIA